MSEFKPVRTRSIAAFAKEVKAASLSMFKSKDGVSHYLAQDDAPHVALAFVSTKIKSKAGITKPVISTFLNEDGEEYHVMHNEGTGKEAEAKLF